MRGGDGVSLQRNCRVRLRYFWGGWFGSFALQNLQAFSNNKVTNVSVCTKNKSNFILRELYFVFEVVSVFRSSRKYLSNVFMFVHFIQTLFIKYFV